MQSPSRTPIQCSNRTCRARGMGSVGEASGSEPNRRCTAPSACSTGSPLMVEVKVARDSLMVSPASNEYRVASRPVFLQSCTSWPSSRTPSLKEMHGGCPAALDLKVPTAETLSGGPWPDVLVTANGFGGSLLRRSMLCEVSSGTAPRASGTPLQGVTVVGFSIVVTASMDLHTL